MLSKLEDADPEEEEDDTENVRNSSIDPLNNQYQFVSEHDSVLNANSSSKSLKKSPKIIKSKIVPKTSRIEQPVSHIEKKATIAPKKTATLVPEKKPTVVPEKTVSAALENKPPVFQTESKIMP